MGSGFTMTPANFFSSHGCLPSWPMDLPVSGLFKCSLTWFSCMDVESSLLQEVSSVGEVYLVKVKNPIVPGNCSSSGRKAHCIESGPACRACTRAMSKLLRVFRCAMLIPYSRSALISDCIYFYSDTSRLPSFFLLK